MRNFSVINSCQIPKMFSLFSIFWFEIFSFFKIVFLALNALTNVFKNSRILRNKIGMASSNSTNLTQLHHHHPSSHHSPLPNYSIDSKDNVRHAIASQLYSPIYAAATYSCHSNGSSSAGLHSISHHHHSSSQQIPSSGSSFHHGMSSKSMSPVNPRTTCWLSPHSVQDLLNGHSTAAVHASMAFRTPTSIPSGGASVPVPSPGVACANTGHQLGQPGGIHAHPNADAAAAAAVQSHYSHMQNYYMQYLHHQTATAAAAVATSGTTNGTMSPMMSPHSLTNSQQTCIWFKWFSKKFKFETLSNVNINI